jgi:hypothetical protein
LLGLILVDLAYRSFTGQTRVFSGEMTRGNLKTIRVPSSRFTTHAAGVDQQVLAVNQRRYWRPCR